MTIRNFFEAGTQAHRDGMKSQAVFFEGSGMPGVSGDENV